MYRNTKGLTSNRKLDWFEGFIVKKIVTNRSVFLNIDAVKKRFAGECKIRKKDRTVMSEYAGYREWLKTTRKRAAARKSTTLEKLRFQPQ